MALLIMIGMMIVLTAIMFAVLGKGEYQPPPVEEQVKGSISQEIL